LEEAQAREESSTFNCSVKRQKDDPSKDVQMISQEHTLTYTNTRTQKVLSKGATKN